MTISIDKLRPGMVVAENIYINENSSVPMIFANVPLTDLTIKQLKEKGKQFIKVKFKKDVEETVNDEIQEIAMQSVRNFDVKSTLKVAQDIVGKILVAKYLSYDLSKYSLQNEDVYQRVVDVCCFATALGKIYNMKRGKDTVQIDLNNLAVAALLHKLGTIYQDENNLKKAKWDVALDQKKFQKYDKDSFVKYNPDLVPLYSFSILKDNPGIDSTVKLAVLLSEEDMMEEGPLGVTKEFMNTNTNQGVVMEKILKICNYYESLLTKVINFHKSPSNVIEIMKFVSKNGKLDENLTNLFLSYVPLYPIGVTVELSNRKVAKVVKINEELLDKPFVFVEEDGDYYDLARELNLTITDICDYELDNKIVERTR
ncbi:MAG: hypothetical protein PHQ64_02925 [Bacilli bacterium]|nr:hypothetical protein [Bacilli bacterium]